ncbi:MAG: type IV pilus secretin PilQ [Nitrospinae bacterium]|nr:type IV pilus secretin PilQ [Nitrospinota bacterium]
MQNAECRMQNIVSRKQYSARMIFTVYCLLFTAYFLSGCAAPKKITALPPAKPVESKPAQTKAEKPIRKPSLKKVYAEPSADMVQLTIETTDPLQYTAFKLNDPSRLLIDLSNVGLGDVKSPIKVEKGAVGTVTLHYFEQSNTARVEIGLSAPISHEILKPAANKIIVSIKNKSVEDSSIAAAASGKIVTVNSIDVQRLSDGKTRIIVKTDGGEPRFTLMKKEDLKRLYVDVENAHISPQGQKALDTAQVSTFVKKVSSFQHKDEPLPIVRIVAELTEIPSYNISRDGANIILDIEPPGVASKKIEAKQAASADAKITDTLLGEEKKYTGRKISLDFQDADINNILRLIAEVSELNVITSENVKGKVTMRLINIPWDQAMDVILKTNQLDMIREGSIIRIAPATKIAEERKAFNEAKKAAVESKVVEEEVEELTTEIFSISYAKAGDLTKNLEKLKSKRGDITIDERTNTLIVKDTRRKMAEMKSLIDKLDKRTPQVLIEARIVEVSRNFSKQLGIEWGGKFNLASDINFPNTVGITGSSVGTSAVSLPAAAGSGSGGAISATLGSVTGATQLDVRLSALEATGKARILSTPKITTLDNKEAIIESGRSVPYPTTSSAGTTVQFVDATISLTVKPQITPDNYVSMKIVATKNEADFANQVQGTPSIIKKKATTEVLIKDGDTTVIGGLYKTTKTENIAGVPWFMKIPILGWLFKKQTDTDDGEELLIFITPKIIRS